MGSTVEPETSFPLTIMVSGRHEPALFVSQSTKVETKALDAFSPPEEQRSLSEPGIHNLHSLPSFFHYM